MTYSHTQIQILLSLRYPAVRMFFFVIFSLCCLPFNLHSGCVRASPPLIHLCLSLAPKPRTSTSHQRRSVNPECVSLICSADWLMHLCQVTLTCCMWHTSSPVPLLTFPFYSISPHFLWKCLTQWFLQFLIRLTCTWWMRLWSYCFVHGKVLKYSSNTCWCCSTVSHADSGAFEWHWCIGEIQTEISQQSWWIDGLPWNNKTSTVSTILVWSSHWPLAQRWNLLIWSELLSNHQMDLDAKLSFHSDEYVICCNMQ